MMSLIAAGVLATAVTAGGNVERIEVVGTQPWTGLYLGGAVQATQTYIDGESDWFGTSDVNKVAYGVQGDIGYTFFNNGDFAASVEGRVGASVGDYAVETTYVAAYIKPEVIFGDFSVYGLLGYGALDYTDANVNDYTYGGGFQYAVTEQISAFADYVVLPAFGDVESDIVSMGINYKF